MKIRNSNFELLRILSMLMIVAHHYSVHGYWNVAYGVSIPNMLIDFLFIGGKIGVILFVMITGYHMINSKISIRKFIQLELEIIFYSVIITLFFYLFPLEGSEPLTTTDLTNAFLPIIKYAYWFATMYMILYLFIPFLNKLLLSLDKKEYKKLFVIGFILFTIIPTFFETSLYVGDLIYFMFYYMIGAYFKLFPRNQKKRWCFLVSTFSYLAIFMTTIIFEYFSTISDEFIPYINYFSGINTLLVLTASISIFLLFKNIKMKNYKWINVIAGTTFGIYLIHDHHLTRQFLWRNLFKNNIYYDNKYLLLHAIIAIFIVFLVSMIIDLFRRYLLEKPMFTIYDKLKMKILKIIKKFHKHGKFSSIDDINEMNNNLNTNSSVEELNRATESYKF